MGRLGVCCCLFVELQIGMNDVIGWAFRDDGKRRKRVLSEMRAW